MKQLLLIPAILCIPASAFAKDLILQLQSLPSVQFAGYYAAEEMGYYDAEGLDVMIKPGGPDIPPTQVLASGRADVIVEWMPAALAAREKGLPLVNIAQPFQSSSLSLVCLKASGISDPKTDFVGKSFGVWFNGNEYPFLNWMSKLGLSPDEITMLPQDGIDLLHKKRAACIHAKSYREIPQLGEAGLVPERLSIFKYNDHEAATLEDGLYALETTIQDRPEDLKKFVRASMKGWKYAQTNPKEAAEIVLKKDKTGPQDIAQQILSLQEVNKLTNADGVLKPADYQRTIETLLSGDSYQVISTAPDGAWTHAITNAIAEEKAATTGQPQQ